MLDLARLERVKLRRTPWGQLLMARLLRVDYAFPRKTEIVLEGTEHLEPGQSYVFAMNHTDRYNYWPFQYSLYRRKLGYTATWVKGKYYENNFMGAFMDAMNNIPLPSRGYVISTEFRRVVGRAPSSDEYRVLRDLADGLTNEPPEALAETVGDLKAFLRDFSELFERMIERVMELNRLALDLGQHLLVFPQGTRSVRLSRGHIGVAQVAQHLGVDIVPVGCNGSDGLYPGASPFSSGGKVVYRIGAPIRLEGPELAPFRVTEPFHPFTLEAGIHREAFQGMTDVVMDHINELLDEPYQYGDDHGSDGVSGMDRFVAS
ncbi:MAG: 1-acyl-sn-glycerol-3-phosphate acyltransferase [Deltaproteobacteria bacterium]|nr:1-acyl-sn-glycerol-3-phosphate acyltransferase [Deltaproteobacteria bacterium]